MQEKAAIVREIQEKAGQAQLNILANFQGLKVEDLNRLRRQLQEIQGEITVVKNTLLERAAGGESPIAPLMAHFTGPNSLTLAYQDPVAVAKILIKFAQEKPQFKLKAGVMGGALLLPPDIEALSKLPAKEVLLAQLLGVMKGVPTALVTVLSGVIRNLLNVLVALKEQKEGKNGGAEETAAPAEG
ncbi:MAG: 50S ribosomal protein L10 [Deltaproteobacteria bacterium]|nr:50S ribosomal protein L10 [Deltaproteobacteria bacterium]